MRKIFFIIPLAFVNITFPDIWKTISIFLHLLIENVKLNFFTANFVKFHVHIITLNIKAKYTHQ